LAIFGQFVKDFLLSDWRHLDQRVIDIPLALIEGITLCVRGRR